MKTIKVNLKDVLSDDMNNPFWKYMTSTPKYKKFEQDITEMINQYRNGDETTKKDE